MDAYENTMSIERLRIEIREAWDLQAATIKALRDLPEVPPYDVLLFLSEASKWPDDNSLGKELQRKVGSSSIPFKSEAESGAGLWTRIRTGLLPSPPHKETET